MKTSLRLLLAALVALAPVASAAQPVTNVPIVGTRSVGSGTAPVVSAPSPTPPANTFVTVKDGAATVSGGTIVGDIIMWAVLVIGAPLAGFVVALIVKLLNKFGVDVSDANRARLKEFVENGIALGAQRLDADLKGKLPIEVKNQVAVSALKYVQEHGADTLKKLGYDPNDPKAIEAIQARVAKALDDRAASLGTVNVTQAAS